MNIQDVKEVLLNSEAKSPELSPTEAWLAVTYSNLAGELSELLMAKPSVWLGIRRSEGVKSDAQADRQYELTDAGNRTIRVKLEMQAIGKLLSSVRARLRLLSDESHNFQ